MKIEVQVPMSIFEMENVKRQSDKIFEQLNKAFQERYNEIIKFAISYGKHIDYQQIEMDKVMTKFKCIFFEEIANRAIQAIFTEGCHDLVEQLILELSQENIEKAIRGECMIDAIAYVMRQIPIGNIMIKVLNESMIMQLQSRFLGIIPFSQKSTMKNE